MRNFNLLPVVLLILFVLVPLINRFLKRMGRRFEQPSRPRQPIGDMGFRRQPAPLSPSPDTRAAAPATPSTQSATPRKSRESRTTLLSNRYEMRRAIIAMTLLGPCRANEPPD